MKPHVPRGWAKDHPSFMALEIDGGKKKSSRRLSRRGRNFLFHVAVCFLLFLTLIENNSSLLVCFGLCVL